jgi:ABC-type molybdate transport system substrate-binding protein
VRESSQQASAKAFVDYVRFTPSAQGILRAWGFARP